MDADYVLLLDADMVFWVNPNLSPDNFKRALITKDCFYLYQGTDAYYYKNTRIVKNKLGFTYWGVTHEYVKSPENSKNGQIEKHVAFIKDIGDGGSKSDKSERDIRLLLKGLETEPNNDRYTFYLANSYNDAREFEKAISYYEKRIVIGGWIEEVWYSYYQIGRCYQKMNQMENAICAWMNGYEKYPNRIENLYEIIQHYRIIGKQKLAYCFYLIADDSRKRYLDQDYLFMQKDVYDYKLDYEFSVFGYYHNPDKIDLAEVSMKVISYPVIENGILTNTLQNYKFYTPKIIRNRLTDSTDNLEFVLSQIGKELNIPSAKYPHFVSSTPTFCTHPTDKNKWVVIVRFVNYHINKEGGYENQEFIETKNVLAIISKDSTTGQWSKESERFLKYNTKSDGLYVGLEDMRLSVKGEKVYYNANRGLERGKMVVEHGWIDLDLGETRNDELLENTDSQNNIEKNWIILPSTSDDTQMIYYYYPFVIGKIIKTEKTTSTKDGLTISSEHYIFQKTHEIQTPPFFKLLRGSCNGIKIGNEIWVLCHLVSYEERRYYYHIMVVLDATTLDIIKYTSIFTFEGEKVEYCLGIQYLEESDSLFFGYSVMDCETKYMRISKEWFDKKMIMHTK
jgi:tetratricopeptide (TPR) repeat protein